jgi:hypothetical protein
LAGNTDHDDDEAGRILMMSKITTETDLGLEIEPEAKAEKFET